MTASFYASIAFALLVLASITGCNMVALIYTSSHWHIGGVVVAILATAAAYWSQCQYTQAGWFRDEFERLGPSFSGIQASADKAEMMGQVFQFVSMGLVVAALVCFVWGLL